MWEIMVKKKGRTSTLLRPLLTEPFPTVSHMTWGDVVMEVERQAKAAEESGDNQHTWTMNNFMRDCGLNTAEYDLSWLGVHKPGKAEQYEKYLKELQKMSKEVKGLKRQIEDLLLRSLLLALDLRLGKTPCTRWTQKMTHQISTSDI